MSITFHLFDSIAQDIRSEGKDTYTIHLFGSTPEGKPVRVQVTGFRPFFYVQLPTLNSAYADFLEQMAAETRMLNIPDDAVSYQEVEKAPMYGYSGGKKLSLIKISTASKKAFYSMKKLFLDQRSRPIYKLYHDSDTLKVYDAGLDPMLRFFHLQNLQPCGWVTIDCEDDGDDTITTTCDWESVSYCDKPPKASAPFKINFWDIECYSESGDFPMAGKGDPIIQIGNVIVQQGKPTKKVIFVVGSCDPVNNTTEPVKSFPFEVDETNKEKTKENMLKAEKQMLKAWAKWMVKEDPDILVGYNIFGFDEKYLWERAAAHNLVVHTDRMNEAIDSNFKELCRMDSGNNRMRLETKFLSSSALGDNMLYYWNTIGRLQVDLYHYIRRSASLPSYKLDNVCQYYMSGKLSSVDTTLKESWVLKTKQTGDVVAGRYVVLLDETGEAVTEKMKVVSVEEGKSVTVDSSGELDEEMSDAVKWAVVKDDCPPQEIFRLHREGGSAGRAFVAQYCIQDCDLVYELYKKLDVFNNAMSMANVCSVPVSYIFTRGQGIKIESLIFKECDARNIVVEVQDTPSRAGQEDDAEEEVKEDSYEGAIVLDPIPGFYSESPIGVCDFASLYPSTIISEDISHDSLVWVKDFDLQGNLVAIPFGSPTDEQNAPPGTRFTDIDFDIWRADPNDTRVTPEKIKVGIRVCRYAQKPDGSKHTLPDIVAKLLAARKSKRKEAEKETDIFRKALLDAEQLAYKLTANSLYGQLGSSTFKIRLQHLAASTTSYGRKQILFAKAAIEKFYGPEANDPRCSAKIVYGDTDSLFVDFGVKNPETGELLSGTEAVEATIHITEEAGKFVSGSLKAPHDFEYDKVFDQFIIFSKKRYVGNKYEESATDFKQTSMGIVLKRRDNAPVLKTIYGGAIKILLNERNVPKAVEFVMNKTLDMVQGKMSLSQLTITKSLSARYKPDDLKAEAEALQKLVDKEKDLIEKLEKKEKRSKKEQTELDAADSRLQANYKVLAEKHEKISRLSYPAHKILADRIAKRDPGNAPASGERVGFIYIAPPPGQLSPKLQGERIETPEYIREKQLQPDYKYYIEHQLMKPIGQLFGIMVEKIPGYTVSRGHNTDGDKEVAAINLLFRKALDECDKQSRRAFMTNQFGITVTPRTQEVNIGGNILVTPVTQERRSSRIAEQNAAPKQTTINTYFLHKAMVEQYKKTKASAEDSLKKKDKEDKKKKK